MITELVLAGAAIGAVKYSSKDRRVGEYELKLGYKNMVVLRKPIVVDMRATPHLFVCGLSGSGKTKMIEFAAKDKEVVLLNVFEDDFTSVKGQKIIGNDSILQYLQSLLNTMRSRTKADKPLYLVIDELLVLCIDKAITKAVTDLLAIARHYNIFLIGISQIGTKESVKFKDLFNARVCFRQVEESSYRTILGFSPEDTKIRKREFYVYSDRIERGYTYSIN
jgi:hypothetical protein